jgi:peptidoglycan/xylan/chitin deacetylase (PgdA/CDA1 family)
VSNREIALPLLQGRGMVAEFFVTAAFVGQPGRLSGADVRALADAGMGVQSHGLTHALLADLTGDELEYELRESKRRLEMIVQEPVQALALPGGRGAARERSAALRLGYRDVLNSVPGCNRSRAQGRYLQRIAITRGMRLETFAQLVQWRGALPRVRQLRYHALAWMKQALGNHRYELLRKRVLER